MWTPVADWCDVVHVILTEVPHDRLKALRDGFTTADAVVDPKRARETWGLLPEHVAMAGALESADIADAVPAPTPEVPEVPLPPIPTGGPSGRR